MAKKKKRRRPSLLTKAINLGVLGLAFSRPLAILTSQGFGSFSNKAKIIIGEATGSITDGQPFDMKRATLFYGPMVAAIVLKKAISMVRRTARV